MNLLRMLKRMEIDMHPSSLYLLTVQRSASAESIIGPEVSIAVYHAIDAVTTSATRLTGAIARWQKRRWAVAELSRLSDHMLKDIGVARGEIRALARRAQSRPASHLRPVTANAAGRPAPTAAANDNIAGIAA